MYKSKALKRPIDIWASGLFADLWCGRIGGRMDLHKNIEENDEQYIWRLGRYKDSGLLDMSWDDIADVINRELGVEGSPLAEASYRKPYQQAKRFYDAGVFSESADDEYLAELRNERHELEKEKVKIRDERTELRRVLREQARKESFKEQVVRAISECDVMPLGHDDNMVDGQWDVVDGNDMVATFFDVHAGMRIDNFFNKFDQDVLRDRINRYLDKILEIQYRHGSENIHVILSELVSGNIHPTIRIENNQNLLEQFLMIVSYIADFLEVLSYRFNNVYVYCAPGNHSRMTANKEESLRGENMDILAMPYLEAKMQNFDNVHFIGNDVDDMIAMFDVRGNKVFAIHGDRANMDNVAERLTMYVGVRPDIIYMGHMHTNAMVTSYGIKVIQAGSFCGNGDQYTSDKMLRGNPEEVVSIIGDDGLECNYDVRLD